MHKLLAQVSFVLGSLLLAATPCAASASATPVVVRDVPRPAFLVLQQLSTSRGLEISTDPTYAHLPEQARAVARDRDHTKQKELIKAVSDPNWFSASKRLFIEAVAVEDRFLVEIHPLPRPGFRPPAIKLSGRLAPDFRQKLLALMPPPFPENGGPRDWLAHGREGWKALLAHSSASPAQYDETVAALTEHLRPLAANSRLGNQFKPLQDELSRLAGLAKVHESDLPPLPIQAAVRTNALLFASAQAAAQAAQPEVPAYIYARYEVQAVDRKHLPFPEPESAEPAPQ